MAVAGAESAQNTRPRLGGSVMKWPTSNWEAEDK